MLQVVDASFKDVANIVERMNDDKACFVGKDVIQVSSNIEKYVAQLRECMDAENIPVHDRIEAKILVEVRICSEYRAVIDEDIAPFYISCAMLVDMDFERHSLINPTDLVIRTDNFKLVTGHVDAIKITYGIDQVEDLWGNSSAIFREVIRLQAQGRTQKADEYFLRCTATRSTRQKRGVEKYSGIVHLCLNSVLNAQFVEDAARIKKEGNMNKLGIFVNVSKGFFDVSMKEEQSASATQTFAPITFPFLGGARKACISKASCFSEVRKTAIGLWECLYGNINDMSIKKLRRCKGIQCIGDLNAERRWESHTIYSTVTVGCGFIFPISQKDIEHLNSMIDNRIVELKKNVPKETALPTSRMVDQG